MRVGGDGEGRREAWWWQMSSPVSAALGLFHLRSAFMIIPKACNLYHKYSSGRLYLWVTRSVSGAVLSPL